jgi:hypothetical protein
MKCLKHGRETIKTLKGLGGRHEKQIKGSGEAAFIISGVPKTAMALTQKHSTTSQPLLMITLLKKHPQTATVCRAVMPDTVDGDDAKPVRPVLVSQPSSIRLPEAIELITKLGRGAGAY